MVGNDEILPVDVNDVFGLGCKGCYRVVPFAGLLAYLSWPTATSHLWLMLPVGILEAMIYLQAKFLKNTYNILAANNNLS